MSDVKDFLPEEGLEVALREVVKQVAKRNHVHRLDDVDGLPIEAFCADHEYPIGWLMVLSAIAPLIISNHNVWLRCDGREEPIEGDEGYPDLIGLGGILPPITVFWDATEQMTSNSKPEPFEVSASSQFSANYAAYRAFGKSARESSQDAWTTAMNTFDLTTGEAKNETGQWLQIKLPKPALLTKYAFHSRNVTINIGESTIRDFQLLGSNDGINWTELDARINTPRALLPYQRFEFMVYPDQAYQYFRLNITRITIGDAGRAHVGVADLFLYETSNLPPRVRLPNIPLVDGKFTYINAKKL